MFQIVFMLRMWALKKKYLPKMARGEMISAIAMSEPNTGSDLQGIQTKAVDQGDHYLLNGQKTFITNGVLTYDQFEMQIDNYSINITGGVDLVANTVLAPSGNELAAFDLETGDLTFETGDVGAQLADLPLVGILNVRLIVVLARRRDRQHLPFLQALEPQRR